MSIPLRFPLETHMANTKTLPHLDIARLEEIHAATDVSLVLHGGSGIPDDQLLEAFSKGINRLTWEQNFWVNIMMQLLSLQQKMRVIRIL